MVWNCEPDSDVGFCGATEFQTVSLGVATGAASFLMVSFLLITLHSAPTATDEVDRVSVQIKAGAKVYIHTVCNHLAIFSLTMYLSIVALYIAIPPSGDVADGIRIGMCYLSGVISSGITGYAGLSVACETIARVTQTAKQSPLPQMLRSAHHGGCVMSYLVLCTSVFGVSFLFYLMTKGREGVPIILVRAYATQAIVGFGLGTSTVSLFMRVGGGIFSQATNIGAGTVLKTNMEDSNDQLGNVVYVASRVGVAASGIPGMMADSFDSLVGSIIAAAILAEGDVVKLSVPFWLTGVGTVASTAAFFFTTKYDGATHEDLVWAFYVRILVSAAFVFALSMAFTIPFFGNDPYGWRVLGCIMIGLVAGILIRFTTEYFTVSKFWGVKSIVASGVTGPATVIIQGLGIGMISCVAPVLVIFMTILASDVLAGPYGIAISAVGMISTLGTTMGIDSLEPIAKTSRSLARVAKLDNSVCKITDSLDELARTFAGPGKGAAIGCAILSSFSLFFAFKHNIEEDTLVIDLTDAYIMGGVLFGSMLPFLLAALTMLSVHQVADKIVETVRHQFVTTSGQGEGSAPSDNEECVLIATRTSLRAMVLTVVITVMSPMIVGFLVGPASLAGMLAGAIVSGTMLAITMSNSGGAWDSSKYYVETHEDKDINVHKACIVGDTVGNPFKDTAAPALNVFIKLMCIVSLLIAPIIKDWNNWEYFYVGFVPILVCIATLVRKDPLGTASNNGDNGQFAEDGH